MTSNNVAADNASAYWAMATAPAVNRFIPFATTFGNHDDMPMEFEDSWFGPSGSPLSSPGKQKKGSLLIVKKPMISLTKKFVIEFDRICCDSCK